MLIKSIAAWAAFAAAVIVTACGGGGGGIGGTGSPVAASYGGVTAIGSVWVNGVEFNTASATIRDRSGVNVVPKAGMVVQVDGSISAARADSVTVEGAVRGLIEQVVGTSQIVVMGQTVRIDDRTCGDGLPETRPSCGQVVPLALGDGVEVHGLVVSGGVISGGYIRKTSSSPAPAVLPYAVKGFASNVSGSSFRIGNLSVAYTAQALTDLGGALTDGQLVEVQGAACSGPAPTCVTLTATSIRPSGLRTGDISQVEAEGFVSADSVPGSATFRLGSQLVDASGASFVGGAQDDILPGSELEAEGAIRNGVLIARTVTFKDSIRIEADVSTRTDSALTLNGLPGITVTLAPFTDLSDFGSASSIPLTQHVRVRARPGPNGAVVAMRVDDRNSADDGVELQATISEVNGNTRTLLGIAVDTGPIQRFFNANGGPMSRTDFLAAAKVNALVKTKGTRLNATTVTWTEIELED